VAQFLFTPLDRTMNKRTIWLASIVFAFVALVIHSVTREKFDAGSKLKANGRLALGGQRIWERSCASAKVLVFYE
jgi:hypothetical protein